MLPRRVRTIVVLLVASGAYVGLLLLERWPVVLVIFLPVMLVECTWTIQQWFRRVTPPFHAAVRRHDCNDAELPMSRLASFAIVVTAVVVLMSVCVASVMVSVLPFVLLFRHRDLGRVGSLAVALCLAPLSAFVLGVVALLSFRVKTVVAMLVALSKPAPSA